MSSITNQSKSSVFIFDLGALVFKSLQLYSVFGKIKVV